MKKTIVCLQNLPDWHKFPDIRDNELSAKIRDDADRAAVAAALRLKAASGCRVLLLSAGDVKRALALGGDEGIKIEFKGEPDGYGLAYAFAEAIKGLGGADLVLLGACPQGLGASLLGEMLKLPNLGQAFKLIYMEKGAVEVTVEEELGFASVYELPLPSVVSVALDAYKNIYSTVSGIIRAEASDIKTLSNIVLPKPLTETLSISQLKRTEKCRMISGSVFEAAESLKEILQGFRTTE